ncbi:MAG: hypothetical protein CMM54_00480 [Rhodospirillaceae bacterium]|nr:hypothetical protein [Rhodospirillaceae bacterium]
MCQAGETGAEMPSSIAGLVKPGMTGVDTTTVSGGGPFDDCGCCGAAPGSPGIGIEPAFIIPQSIAPGCVD